MKHSRIILIASLLAIIASIFTFSYFQKGSNEPQNTINTTVEVKKPEIKALPPRDNTLARFQKTRMENIPGPYKKLTVSDGEVAFSFEVPDTWLTELRNSGELAMNETELRDFWATNYFVDIKIPDHGGPEGGYWDLSWDDLQKRSFAELKGVFDIASDNGLSPGVPAVAISEGNLIRYFDMNHGQTNFFIAKNTELPKRYEPWLQSLSSQGTVNVNVKGVKYKKTYIPVDDNPASGKTYLSIPLSSKKTLIIDKQRSLTEAADTDFEHLIDTLRLEP